MENFDQIFTLLGEQKSIILNTNILETGLINILALIAILIYTGRDFLGSLLEERRTVIVKGVQDSENRLNEARKRLIEVENLLNQANLVISEIKIETIATKKVILASDSLQAKKELATRFATVVATYRTKERQTFLEIKQQIVSLVLQRTVNRLREIFKSKEQAAALINKSTNKLKGDLL